MHPLLAEQLRLCGLSGDRLPDADGWARLLKMLSFAYDTSAGSDNDGLPATAPVDPRHARIEAMASALPDLLLLLNGDGIVLEALAAKSTHGIPGGREQIVGKDLVAVFPPFVAGRLRGAMERALGAGKPSAIEYEMTTNEGDRKFEARMLPAELQSAANAVVLLARDITEKNRIERRNRLAGKVMEAATEGVVILDDLGRVMSVNPAFERIFGFPQAELVGRQAGFLQDPNDKRFLSTLWREINLSGSWHGELTATRQDGRQFPVWLTMDCVKDDYGNVTHYVALLSDVSELKRSRKELEHVATHDSLTGLPNRVLFMDRLEHALARSARSKMGGAILFLDLDRFKTVNDNLGHNYGDRLLRHVAIRLRRVARAQDTLARLGGDEFTLILEDLEEEEFAARVAGKIINELSAPFDLGEVQLETTTSIGISVFPRDGHKPEELLKNADTAMYSAKEAGRNRYRFFTQELTINAFEHFSLEQALRRAIAGNEFFLEYQPQYHLATGALAGVEALIRWRTADGTLVPPGRFINVAEASGLIEPIGLWVVREVCEQLNRWDRAQVPAVPVAINLSARQLANPDLAAEIKSVMASQRIDGGRLEFEITESAIITHGDVAYKNLTELHDVNARLSIDDFGTGHSSLVNLKRFPLSRLKIDRTFVRDLAQDANDEAIVRATIALSKSLGLEVIAEGVETEHQLNFLREAECDMAQGFLLAMPMVADKVTALMSAGDGAAPVMQI